VSDDLCFASRDLKPHAEPVSPRDLREGHVYFAVQFVDRELLIPTVEPLVFIGQDLEAEAPGMYFQDAQSYRDGLRYGSEEARSENATFYAQTDVKHIFDYERALDQMLACSLRRARTREP
jgi:hypothetical protein